MRQDLLGQHTQGARYPMDPQSDQLLSTLRSQQPLPHGGKVWTVVMPTQGPALQPGSWLPLPFPKACLSPGLAHQRPCHIGGGLCSLLNKGSKKSVCMLLNIKKKFFLPRSYHFLLKPLPWLPFIITVKIPTRDHGYKTPIIYPRPHNVTIHDVLLHALQTHQITTLCFSDADYSST